MTKTFPLVEIHYKDEDFDGIAVGFFVENDEIAVTLATKISKGGNLKEATTIPTRNITSIHRFSHLTIFPGGWRG